MKRRTLIGLVAAAGAVAAVALVPGRVRGRAARIVVRLLPETAAARDVLDAFARDFDARVGTPAVAGPALGWDDRLVLTAFVTWTNFAYVRGDVAQLRYLGPDRPCANPFARFD